MAFISQKYGYFKDTQLADTKRKLRKAIFFLLLCVEDNRNKDKDNHRQIDVNQTFNSLMYKLEGLNSLLSYPEEIVTIYSLLERAKIEYNKPDFDFKLYRKLIFDAGAEVLKIKERSALDA